MIDLPAGTVMHNPVTHEWARILELTPERVRSELVTAPGGGVAIMHRHPVQVERFDVLSGRLTATLDGDVREFGPGESAVIQPGVAHNWQSSGDEPLYARVTVTPPGSFAEMILAVWGLSATGRATADGGLGPLDGLLVAEAFGADFEPTSPPRWVQRLTVRTLAPLVRRTGRSVTDDALLRSSVVAADRWPGPSGSPVAERELEHVR
jgi:quercetin dioxygenase-like cupin family protein